jgi:hypothetical protein
LYSFIYLLIPMTSVLDGNIFSMPRWGDLVKVSSSGLNAELCDDQPNRPPEQLSGILILKMLPKYSGWFVIADIHDDVPITVILIAHGYGKMKSNSATVYG